MPPSLKMEEIPTEEVMMDCEEEADKLLAEVVTTFPPFTLSNAYLGLSFPNPHSCSRFVSHVTFPPLSHLASLSLADVVPLHRYLGL